MMVGEQEVSGPGMAVATLPSEERREVTLTPEAEVARAELEQMRMQGAALIERRNMIRAMAKIINGMVWGAGNMAVQGSSLSEGTLTEIARVCVNLEADPALHINLLGNTLYLNAAFWTRELNQAIQNGIVRSWRVENISPRFQQQMRSQGESALADAETYKDEEMRSEGRRYLALARYAAASRAFHEIPDAVEKNPLAAIYEVVVEFPTDRDPVRESSFAPNSDRDPVGRARPAETARTRVLRRGAIKALPRLRQRELAAANEGLAAEWSVVQSERQATQQLQAGPQAVASGGHPSAAPTAAARPLPVEEAPPAFDVEEARRGLFATLRDAKVPEKDRKKWATDNGFKESTKEWGREDFERAREILTAPIRDAVLARLRARGIDLAAITQQMIGKEVPTYLVDWTTIQAKLDSLDQNDAGGDL